MPFDRVGMKRVQIFFGDEKCELIANFSANVRMVTICEERNEKCEFLATESVNSSPIQCDNGDVTSVCFCLSVRLSVCLSV